MSLSLMVPVLVGEAGGLGVLELQVDQEGPIVRRLLQFVLLAASTQVLKRLVEELLRLIRRL